MKRIPWKRNHKCEQPSRVVFYDTETIAYPSETYPGHFAHKLALGVAQSWVNYKGVWSNHDELRFTDASDFWRWLYDFSRKRRPTWVYAHNAAFDFTVVGGWAELDIDNLRIIEVVEATRTFNNNTDKAQRIWRGKTALDGTPFILETRHDGGSLKFVDSYNYWPIPLSELGLMVGLPKLEFPNLEADVVDRFAYCERDVAIVEKAVMSLMDFWKQHDVGNWQPTAASLAFSAYRHGRENCQIVAHGDQDYDDDQRSTIEGITGSHILSAKEVTDCERRSYCGGRVSVLFLGDIRANVSAVSQRRPDLFHNGRCEISGPVTVLDVNSLYPFVMKEYPHPIELMDAIKFPSMSLAQQLIEEFPCCADVEIDTDGYEYPHRQGNSTSYCQGRFATTLIGPELHRAVRNGEVRAICNLCVYHYGRPFNNYIAFWSGRRAEFCAAGRTAEANFCKLLMNSLYGKLAQQTPSWTTCGHVVPPVRWGGFISQPNKDEPPCFMRAIGGVSQYQSTAKSCRHTFVAAAASVTSWGRVYLDSIIAKCPTRSVVYTDTDSLFCLPPATEALKMHGLIHPTDLGKLKDKGTYNEVRIWGQKDYELDGVRVIAGLRADAKVISERLWEQVNFEGVKQIIQHDPDGTILQRNVKFSPSVQLSSRVVNYDGWTTPLRIE